MKLKDICEINPRTQGIADYMSVSFVPMHCVSEDGKIDTSEIRQFIDVKKGYTVFQENDVLFAKITPCMENGKGAIARGLMNGIGCGSSEFHVLRANNEMVCPEWIYYLTAWSSFRREAEKHMTGSAGQRRVPKAYLENYDINVPSLPEQTKQTEVLSQLQQIIDCRKEELQKLDELIKARFVELFGNSEYPSEPLDNNVIEMFIGPFGSSLKNECFVDEEDGFCMVYEQKHAIQKTMNVPTRYVPKSKYEELKRFAVVGGDIIVSCRGTIGEIFIVPEDAPMGIMHPSIMKIRLDTTKYNQKFFVFALEQYMDEHNAEAKGSGVKMAVSATVLGQSDFVLPPIEIQNQFAAFVEQTDKSKVAVQKALDESQLLFDSLMQKYFG